MQQLAVTSRATAKGQGNAGVPMVGAKEWDILRLGVALPEAIDA
jgi:hypothetical protein